MKTHESPGKCLKMLESLEASICHDSGSQSEKQDKTLLQIQVACLHFSNSPFSDGTSSSLQFPSALVGRSVPFLREISRRSHSFFNFCSGSRLVTPSFRALQLLDRSWPCSGADVLLRCSSLARSLLLDTLSLSRSNAPSFLLQCSFPSLHPSPLVSSLARLFVLPL